MKINVIEVYREMNLSRDPIEMAGGPKGLVEPRYPVLIPDLWNHAYELFASNLDYQPPTEDR